MFRGLLQASIIYSFAFRQSLVSLLRQIEFWVYLASGRVILNRHFVPLITANSIIFDLPSGYYIKIQGFHVVALMMQLFALAWMALPT